MVRRTQILDTPPEPAFDELTRLATRLFEVPMAIIGLLDSDRLWFKSATGLDLQEISRSEALCAQALQASEAMLVDDMASEPDYADHPLVAGPPHIRFFACLPLVVRDGIALGAFCIMDTRPRHLTDGERKTLTALAGHAAALLDLRLQRADLEAAVAERDQVSNELSMRSQHLAEAQRIAQLGSWEYWIDTGHMTWTEQIFQILGLEDTTVEPSLNLWYTRIHPDDLEVMRLADERLLNGEAKTNMEIRIVRPSGETRYVWLRAEVLVDERGRRRVSGTNMDITDRRRIEAKLSAAEAGMELASRLAHVGAWSVDLASGRVTWSDEVYAIHEMVPGTEITPEQGIEFFAPEFRQEATEAFQACARDGIPFEQERLLITGEGNVKWVRGIGRPVRDKTGQITGVQGAFQDIDAQKRSELEVRRLAQRLEATLESITESFFTVDRDWRFTYVNAEAARWLGRSRDDLLATNLWSEFPTLVGTGFHDCYQRAMDEQVAVSFEGFYPPLARWFNVRAYPSAEGLAVYAQDVTDTRAALNALRESEARFRLVAKATADTIWDHDVRSGSVWWSDDFPTRLGYDPAELPASRENWLEVMHPEDVDRVQAIQQLACQTGRDSWEVGYRLIARDGTILHMLDRAFLMRDESGALIREIGGLTDLSQRVEYEERLHQAQRLEAIGKLTGGIAHDFNNLLTVILGNAELLIEQVGDSDRPGRLARMTATAAQRGAELTNRLLAFARRQTLNPAAIDANRLIADMDGLLRRTIGEQIEIEFVRAAGLWHPIVDPAQLENAILNLCINARDAMPGGGRLSIETANVHLSDDYSEGYSDVKSGQYVMIAVADTGSGMPPEVVAQAFEPFYTTKGVGKGTGLGLSVVHGFVKQSDGHVKIYSEVGEGTSVKIYLPRASLETGVVESKEQSLPTHGGTERILVVEDDDLVRQNVTDQLESLGYLVVAASNGPEAIDILRTDQPFDLLFSDIVMPGGMNGRQVADEAGRLRPDLRVLFTSGYTENAIVHHGRLDRGVHLINKPYRRRDLARKLRMVLDEPNP